MSSHFLNEIEFGKTLYNPNEDTYKLDRSCFSACFGGHKVTKQMSQDISTRSLDSVEPTDLVSSTDDVVGHYVQVNDSFSLFFLFFFEC